MTGRERTENKIDELIRQARRLPVFARKEIACALIASTLGEMSKNNCIKQIKKQ
jgi:hypothetical protein|tara:strand:+ start:71 stop:232 length:162 start_codon:yes stop_codon:yes gene_type:complete